MHHTTDKSNSLEAVGICHYSAQELITSCLKSQNTAELIVFRKTFKSPHWIFFLCVKAGGQNLPLMGRELKMLSDIKTTKTIDLPLQKHQTASRIYTNSSLPKRGLWKFWVSFTMKNHLYSVQRGTHGYRQQLNQQFSPLRY